MRLDILFNDRGHEVDGIRDYSEELTRVLAARPRCAATLVTSVVARTRLGRSRAGSGADVVVLQYSPFCYGRWGFAPWLALRALGVRARRSPGTRLAIMVHEPYVALEGWSATLMGLWQRLQLRALHSGSDVVFVSIERWATTLGAWLPRRPVHHLPVGSNLPDRRDARGPKREALGIGEAIVVAALGRKHPGWVGELVARAVNEMEASGRPIVLLLLGAEAPSLPEVHDSVRVVRPGPLSATALAEHLAAADLFLAPYLDGVSTRRGAMMAALQHGLPVIGTIGELTDGILRDATSAMTLVPADNSRAFEAAARDWIDAYSPVASGSPGRDLYELHFDWDVIVDRMLAALGPGSGRPEGSRP